MPYIFWNRAADGSEISKSSGSAIGRYPVSERVEVIFFDLGDTQGSAVLSSPPIHLVAFDVYPSASQLLSDLQHQGIRLGIISNTGDDGRETVDAVLRAVGIVDYFEPGLRLYSHDIGLTKDSPHKSRGTCAACRLTATLPVRRRGQRRARIRTCRWHARVPAPSLDRGSACRPGFAVRPCHGASRASSHGA
jgi:hypothetical protein